MEGKIKGASGIQEPLQQHGFQRSGGFKLNNTSNSYFILRCRETTVLGSGPAVSSAEVCLTIPLRRELSVDDPRRQLEVLNKLSLALNGCRNGNLSAAELSEERRAQMEQSISHLIYSEVSRDEISRELSVNDPRTQLVVLDKLSLVLNTYRNRLIPINRLPQDIMHHIFSIALQLENMHQVELAVSADYSLKVVDQRGRLRLVSRSWNSFVVSTPEFWSLVDTAVMDQALLSRRIERAQQRELCITHQLGYYSPTESQQLAIFLSPYLNRIRTLRLGSTYVATALLKNSFPALRTLELRGGLPLARFILVQDCFPRL
ncbi:hypothetical protein FRC01_013171, partial [Tulasnella sp. 417]